jgi:hypothetical protein
MGNGGGSRSQRKKTRRKGANMKKIDTWQNIKTIDVILKKLRNKCQENANPAKASAYWVN